MTKAQLKKSYLEKVMESDPAATNRIAVRLTYAGYKALCSHITAHNLWTSGHKTLARIVANTSRRHTGVEIHPGAKIGKSVMIDHGAGVVIGETAEVGDNCILYQGVTLGGTGKDVGKRHPTLGNNVLVGSGAKILGPVTIGDNVKVAAGAVVLTELPDHSTAVGIPAKVVRVGGQRVADELDQIHIPDPVQQELNALRTEIDALREKINEKEGQEQ